MNPESITPVPIGIRRQSRRAISAVRQTSAEAYGSPPEPVIGLAQRVRASHGPMTSSSETRWRGRRVRAWVCPLPLQHPCRRIEKRSPGAPADLAAHGVPVLLRLASLDRPRAGKIVGVIAERRLQPVRIGFDIPPRPPPSKPRDDHVHLQSCIARSNVS